MFSKSVSIKLDRVIRNVWICFHGHDVNILDNFRVYDLVIKRLRVLTEAY